MSWKQFLDFYLKGKFQDDIFNLKYAQLLFNSIANLSANNIFKNTYRTEIKSYEENENTNSDSTNENLDFETFLNLLLKISELKYNKHYLKSHEKALIYLYKINVSSFLKSKIDEKAKTSKISNAIYNLKKVFEMDEFIKIFKTVWEDLVKIYNKHFEIVEYLGEKNCDSLNSSDWHYIEKAIVNFLKEIINDKVLWINQIKYGLEFIFKEKEKIIDAFSSNQFFNKNDKNNFQLRNDIVRI